ncbi:MAG: hypothetical protein KF708_14530 [Pirellulales bacterium]|nr:hypothetical protein [Pirellulales bacterium]
MNTARSSSFDSVARAVQINRSLAFHSSRIAGLARKINYDLAANNRRGVADHPWVADAFPTVKDAIDEIVDFDDRHAKHQLLRVRAGKRVTCAQPFDKSLEDALIRRAEIAIEQVLPTIATHAPLLRIDPKAEANRARAGYFKDKILVPTRRLYQERREQFLLELAVARNEPPTPEPIARQPQVPRRDKASEALDRLCYRLDKKRVKWDRIVSEVQSLAQKLGLEESPINSIGGARQASQRYAKEHGEPLIPPRKPGRPAKKKQRAQARK